MEAVLFIALLTTAFGAMAWRQVQVQRALGPGGLSLDEAADVAMHLARHEASSRGQAPSPLHILYAVVQDPSIADAIRQAGGDVEAVEDSLFRALEADTDDDDRARAFGSAHVVGWAAFMARRAERSVTCADLFGGLTQTAPEVVAVVDAGGVGAADVLFALVHGPPPARIGGDGGELEVVLVNDDITPQELVVQVLRDVFELDTATADALMLEAHTRGLATVGRFPARVADARIADAHRAARAAGSPLWLRAQSA